jgi:hypothetical protein
MNRPRLGLLAALTLPLLALGAWRWHVNAGRAREMALFMAYEEGPLGDYALGVTRALPSLFKGGSGELAEAKASAARSSQSLNALLASAPEGWVKARLQFVQPLHAQAAALLAELPLKAARRGAWLAEEEALRGKIIYMLEDVRYSTFKTWKWPQSRILELNAMIYSLKEAQEAASK